MSTAGILDSNYSFSVFFHKYVTYNNN